MAKGKMSQGEYDFIAGGATDEITLRRTRAVFDAILMRPRMMVDISQRDLRTTVLGHDIRFPIMLDPAGDHAAAHPEGELASARAAGAAGTILVLSAQSSRTLEEVVQAATGPLWFQSYFFKDRGLTLAMAHRAEAAGYAALCLTLDAKVKPKRERNMRNNYVGPASPNYAHLGVTGSTWSFGLDGPTGANDLRDPASTWPDLDRRADGVGDAARRVGRYDGHVRLHYGSQRGPGVPGGRLPLMGGVAPGRLVPREAVRQEGIIAGPATCTDQDIWTRPAASAHRRGQRFCS